ncbi:MAG: hypothetical protein AB8B55_19780 [Mariniblastus sp.]
MKHLMGLGFAGLLGVIAAGLNWAWISGLATPDEYVAIGSDISIGEELDEEDLIAIPVPGNREDLRSAFIPWTDRAILFGASANRDYVAGDVVFHRDILAPVENSQWDVVGPFKLISVGERFKERTVDELDYTRTDGNTLTIEVDANFDERTKRLLEIIRTDRDDDQRAGKIVAVQVLPSNELNLLNERLQNSKPQNVVYQTVSLDGIANVPRVLLAGNMIRFVVPARPKY